MNSGVRYNPLETGEMGTAKRAVLNTEAARSTSSAIETAAHDAKQFAANAAAEMAARHKQQIMQSTGEYQNLAALGQLMNLQG